MLSYSYVYTESTFFNGQITASKRTDVLSKYWGGKNKRIGNNDR